MKNQMCRYGKIIIAQILILVALGVVMFVARGRYQQEVSLESNIELSKGVYDIVVEYEGAKGDKSWVIPEISVGEEQYLKFNPLGLSGEVTHIKEKIWVSHDIESLSLRFAEGEDDCAIQKIVVSRSYSDVVLTVVFLLLAFVVLDVLWFYHESLEGASRETFRRVIFGLGMIILASSVPLMTDYVINGADLVFHLSRIEGLSEGLLSGQYPVRVQPHWLYGKGYATSVYYSDMFLFVPAMLNILGMPFTDCYKVYVVLVNVTTIVVAYVCFKRIFGEVKWGFLGAVLYGMAPYRLYNMYARAAVGEYTAMLFLPLIMAGLYEIYCKNGNRKGKAWLVLAVGLTGIINCHILTCEMVGGIIILVCICGIKYTFRKEIFVELAKAAIATIAINSWFFVPFLDYMLNAKLWVNNMSASTTIQKRGMYPAHYFLAALFSGSTTDYDAYGMVNGEATTVGIVLFTMLMVFVCKRFIVGREGERQYAGFATVVGALSGLLIVLTLNVFPWDSLQSLHGVLGKLISSLQFPFRLLSPLTVLLVAVTIVVCVSLENKKVQTATVVLLVIA